MVDIERAAAPLARRQAGQQRRPGHELRLGARSRRRGDAVSDAGRLLAARPAARRPGGRQGIGRAPRAMAVEGAARGATGRWRARGKEKLQTNWFTPDEAYEAGCRDFLFDILAPQRRDGFLQELAAFVARISRAGALNSLQQTVLRLASPGIPDLYQGTELWDFSLVDPDNRRPVDFEKRAAYVAEAPPSEFMSNWRDGRVKLAV